MEFFGLLRCRQNCRKTINVLESASFPSRLNPSIEHDGGPRKRLLALSLLPIAQVLSKTQKTLNVSYFAHVPDTHVGAIDHIYDVVSNLLARNYISNCTSPAK